jgi:hypothetical protein
LLGVKAYLLHTALYQVYLVFIIADDETNPDVAARRARRLVEVDGVLVCPLGEGFYTYGQWAVLVDPGATCGGTTGKINVVSAFAGVVSRDRWDACEERVEASTARLLDLFAGAGVRARSSFWAGWPTATPRC